MKIYSWGSNSHGQLGQGIQAEQVLFPLPIETVVEPKSICGGGKHTILLTCNHEIFACGDNDKGQLGHKPTIIKLVNSFHPLNFRLKVVKVACGWDFNLALTENSELFGWGSNSFGQLGLSIKKVKFLSTPQKILESKVFNIGAGLRHSAVVTSGGQVFTSGYGRKGQLGVLLNEKIPPISDEFILVSSIRNCKQISCGECHCIAITENGELYSWGNNKYGQLGVDPATSLFSATPIKIIAVAEVIQSSTLFSGWAHNFILTDSGCVMSWGRNDFGQLGEKRQANWKPEFIKNLENIKQVCLGSHHSVVLTDRKEVLTWGWNEHGNCGNETCDNCLQPHKLKAFSGVKLIGSGAAHSFLWS